MTLRLAVTVLGPADALTVTQDVTAHDGGRFAVRLTVTAGAAVTAGLRASLRLGRTADPGWLVPGVFHGENRVAGCRVRYPRFTVDEPDPAALESDAWSFRADRCATPAVFAWDDTGGAALVTGETSPLGQAGVGFAFEDGRPELRLHFPYREEPVVYDGSPVPRPAGLPAYTWADGERVVLDCHVYVLGADRHAYTGVLRDVHRRTAMVDFDAVPWVSLAEAADLTAWGLYRWHYRAEDAVLLETAAFDRAVGSGRQAMHVSWLSGVPCAYALLRHGRRVGNQTYVDAATAVLGNIAANRTPGGTFWQAADGSLGSGHDVATGEVIDRHGTSGLAWLPALLADGRVAEAQRAGRFYAQAVRD